jgi:HK97 family phage major capsid protein
MPGVTGSGAELKETTFRPDLFIDALRPRSVVLSLGAQNIGGLVGDIQFPREDSTSSAYWLTSSGTSPVVSGAITESEAAFDAEPLVAKPGQVAGFSTASRLMAQQAGELFDSVVANDLIRVLGTAIDVATLQGTGASGQPTGITNLSGVGTASGASFSYATSVSAVEGVANANAIINRGALGWVTTPTTAAVLAQRQKVTGYPQFVWDGNVDSGQINRHTALSTNNVPAGTAIFGDWSQVLILRWGDAPLELEVNPFGSFASGDIQLRAMLSCGVVIQRPQSFYTIPGIT